MSDKDDCISRKMAIDTIMGQPPEPHYPAWYAAQIEKLPAVQPDHNADISKKAEGDCISRKAEIDALDCISGVEEVLRSLPSAQSEPLTDKEQRIFLAAMGREEKVCKQVDDEYRSCREPYEDSLVRTCREIIRKVKGTLWT